MILNELHANELNTSFQTIRARVEIHKGSTLEKICECGKELSEFTIERVGENKFFGYGICQKLKTNFLDEQAALGLSKDNFLEATFGVDAEFIYPFPKFYVEEITRDEETNDLTVIAYDGLYQAINHRVNELILNDSYTIETFAAACAHLLGFPLKIENVNDDSFQTTYTARANFSGDETIRSALDAIAEATQTVYFINGDWELTFKRLDKTGEPVFTINRNNYMEFHSGGNRTLGKVVHYTELGDNVESFEPSEVVEGVTQYVRNNPFWSLREDIDEIVDRAQAAMSGLSIDQFDCDWFGNYLLEIGDKINIVGKENKEFTTYLLNDSITFDGAIEQFTEWQYDENEEENAANPSSLGEKLNQTFARVDKVNQRIELVASKSDENSNSIAALQLNTNSISAFVSNFEKASVDGIESLNSEITALKQEVSAKVSPEDVQIAIKSEIDKGTTKVETETGFIFNHEGLTIEKSGHEMKTQITEDGMTVYKDNSAVLTANNTGVDAVNLKASTYLIIGTNSRFENYRADRTACFWIGE